MRRIGAQVVDNTTGRSRSAALIFPTRGPALSISENRRVLAVPRYLES
jgi:hypothetical protein